jgi:nucleoside-diphosphate-sugar epimerase
MISVTGSHGFVGQGLLAQAALENFPLRAIPRADYLNPEAYQGCHAVIFLAGLAHRKSASLDLFLAINCDLAVESFRAAARAGIKRFVYVSSSKALCDFAENALALDELIPAIPTCDYGRSKRAAEVQLLTLGASLGLEVIIIRPALVIGAPAKANLASLAKLAWWLTRFPWKIGLSRGIFAGFQAQKSYTSLGNLCRALIYVANSKAGNGNIYHVVDDQTLSTSELLEKLVIFGSDHVDGKRLPRGDTSRVLPHVMSFTLKCALKTLGMNATLNALARPLVLDGSKIQRELGWKPEPRIDVELQQIMATLPYLDEGSKG